MAQENHYPSPEPAVKSDAPHPYPSNQRHMSAGVSPHLQSAPTAMMHESTADSEQMPRNFEFISQYSAQAPSTPQQMAQQGLEVNGSATGTDSKKRNKVSRACDECRRKKVRCDAETDQPGTQCSNCKRLTTECQFSRQPQKRGPSKGYIKELADRVSRLEGPAAQEMQYAISQGLLGEGQDYPGVELSTPNQRKRTHSVAEASYLTGPDQLRELADGSAPTPTMPSSTAQAPVHALPEHARNSVNGLGPGALDAYYDYFHTTLPILPDDPSQLAAALEAVPVVIKQAFIASFNVSTKSVTSTPSNQDISYASNAYLAAKSGPSSVPANLLRLQSMIFLALTDALNFAEPSNTTPWLGGAINLASSMHLQKMKSTNPEAGAILRRTYLVLVILDRWFAAARSGATLISDDSIRIDESDHSLLGSPAYHLLRISLSLGHLTSIFLSQSTDLIEQRPTARPILTLMRGEVDRIAESIQPMLPQIPTLNLALLHLQTISEKTTETLYASDKPVIESAIKIVALLNNEKTPPTPLDHHFASMALAILVPALRVDYMSAHDALERLHNETSTARFSPAWKKAISEFVVAEIVKGDNRGLADLADAAMGAGNGNKGEGVERADWERVIERGYMHIFE